MKIGIDVRVLGTKRALDNYTRHLVGEILIQDKDNQYFLVVDEPDKLKGLEGNFQVRKFSPKLLWRDHFWFQTVLKDLDLVFHPDNTEHLLCLKKSVVALHDVIPWKFPKLALSEKPLLNLRQKFYLFAQKYALKRASLILTVSNNSQRDIVETLGINKEKIMVTYEGVGRQFKPLQRLAVDEFRKSRGLEDNYIFYVGGFDIRKNVLLLLQAFSMLEGQLLNLKLILAGDKSSADSIGGNQFRELEAFVKQKDLTDRVKFVGFVPNEELPYYYNGAICFVYPSFYEGFGVPVLEALSCGTPVICNSSSSLPEVVGEAGLTFSNNNLDDLVINIKMVLKNKDLGQSLRIKSLIQAKKFGWDEVAKKTIMAFNSLA